MAEPITISLVATACALGMVRGLSGHTATAAAKQVIDALRRRRTPEGREVLRATHGAFVRSIQVMAEACSVSGGDAADQFSAQALSRLANDPDFTDFQGGAVALPKQELDRRIRTLFEGADPDPAVNTAEFVISEIERRIGQSLTDTHRTLFRRGSSRHRSWLQVFELFFAEQVKTSEFVFRTLAFDQLNEVLALATAQAADIAALHNMISSYRSAVDGRFNSLDESVSDIGADVKEVLARLSKHEQDAPIALLRSLAEAFGESRPDSDAAELEAYLRTKICDYHQLSKRIAAVQHEDNHDSALLADSNQAIAKGEFEEADRLLSEAEGLLDERVDRLMIRKSERRSLRGEAARLQGDYRTAIHHFDAAAKMLPRNVGSEWLAHAWAAAETTQAWGEESNPRILPEAITRWKGLLRKCSRRKAPGYWAGIQTNLGTAFCAMGERQQGTSALVRATKAYRSALLVYTPETAPYLWAVTKMNLANTLRVLGSRQEGSQSLLQAISDIKDALKVISIEKYPIRWAGIQRMLGAILHELGSRELGMKAFVVSASAHLNSMKVYTQEAYPEDWAISQSNLGAVLLDLGQQQRDTKPLNAAIEALKRSLEAIDRSRRPVLWATVQHNLGTALYHLGYWTENVSLLEGSLEGLHAALALRSIDEMPYQWAMTQNCIGTTLQALGGIKQDVSMIDRSIDCFRSVLKVYTYDDSTLDWALTTENLGNSLYMRAVIANDCESAVDAVQALEKALEVFQRLQVEWNREKAEKSLVPAREARDRLHAHLQT